MKNLNNLTYDDSIIAQRFDWEFDYYIREVKRLQRVIDEGIKSGKDTVQFYIEHGPTSELLKKDFEEHGYEINIKPEVIDGVRTLIVKL